MPEPIANARLPADAVPGVNGEDGDGRGMRCAGYLKVFNVGYGYKDRPVGPADPDLG